MLHRRRAPLFAGLAALSVACVLSGGPAGAQTVAPPPASMPSAVPSALPSSTPTANTAADAFAVSGVKVDINAANANTARDQAIREAQSKAWVELYKRLVPGGGNPPRLSETDIARLVQGFEIDEEKVSATRYVGSITVRFRPNAVRDAIGGAGSAQYVEPPTRPFVVLPLTVTDGRTLLWEDRTPWRAAWEERPATSSLVPLVVPDGELPDAQAIGTEEAVNGNADALNRIAQRYHAGGVIVARTELPAGGPDLSRGLVVDLTRYGLDGTRETQTINVKPDASDRPTDFLTRAVTFVGAQLDEAWRRNNVTATGPEQTTLVRVPLGSAADWVETRKRLAGLAAVTRNELLSMTRSEALVNLTHRGDPDRLAPLLNKRDLGLTRVAPPAAMGTAPLPVSAAGWQLTLLPRGSGSGSGDAAAPAANPGAIPLAPSAPLGTAPAAAYPTGGLGAPPRNLGTLPVRNAP
ncbi:DUF2066 domain-containing protein [Azospirillum agricola]|uniref:DUF2066 domain-containing protein n=1 Tax=Azospirillum agricola TaxID=1720247 RepID=UPI000A1C8889|nr:DUF2066 domain-containing protein [Azospirillum agricola]